MITLLAMDEALLDSLESPARFASLYEVSIGDHLATVRDVVTESLDFENRVSATQPWSGYLNVLEPDRVVVGTGGFKGGPDGEESVEIAYSTFPGFEGRGLATDMARALCGIAGASPAVRMVVAHTLPFQSASTRILDGLGFSLAGSVTDPEDGEVWLWELAVDSDSHFDAQVPT